VRSVGTVSDEAVYVWAWERADGQITVGIGNEVRDGNLELAGMVRYNSITPGTDRTRIS
jgi:hypothetical protein